MMAVQRRLTKEFRLLLLPLAFVASGMTLSLLMSTSASLAGMAAPAAVATLFLAIPVLAATAFGAEFQYRTVHVLLAQPVSRSRIWVEKSLVTAGVVTVTGCVLIVLIQQLAVRPLPAVSGSLYLACVACAAPLWTLITRSTIGGTAFTIASLILLELLGGFAFQWAGLHEVGELFTANSPAMSALRVTYAITTLVAGWLVFNRLQVSSEGAASAGTLGALLLPGSFLRCRRGSAVANLFRKELRLQTPAVLVAVVFAVCWMLAVLLFRITPPRYPIAEATFIVLLALYLPLAIVLCGTASFAEDNALGIHAWHLTLPVRPTVHWFVKLAATLIAAAFAVVAVPLAMHAIASAMFGATGWVPELPKPLYFPLLALGGSVILCFWCASLFGQPIRAAVAATLIGAGIGMTGVLIAELSEWLRPLDPLLTWITVKQQLPPDYFIRLLFERRSPLHWLDAVVFALLLIIAVVVLTLSLRAFRHGQIARRLVVRQVALVFLALIISLSATVVPLRSATWFAYGSSGLRSELRSAWLAVSLPHEGTVRVPVETIAPKLSPRTKEWLRDSHIEVERLKRSARQTTAARPLRPIYRLTVTFPNGRQLRELYVGPVEARQ